MTDSELRSELRLAFYKLEKEYRPYFDLFVEHQGKYKEFKGGVTIDGYLNLTPDILILGHNPAHGKYREYGYKGQHLVNQGERPFGFFEYGEAYQSGKWWERNKTIKSPYYANIIELLYSFAEASPENSVYKTAQKSEDKANSKPAWGDIIEKKIFSIFLYNFVTDGIYNLTVLFEKLRKDSDFPNNTVFKEEWDVRRHLIHILRQFIGGYVKPKCIVCLGQLTMSDYTYGECEEYGDGLYRSKKYTNVIGVHRSGTWTKRAREAGRLASEIVFSKE